MSIGTASSRSLTLTTSSLRPVFLGDGFLISVVSFTTSLMSKTFTRREFPFDASIGKNDTFWSEERLPNFLSFCVANVVFHCCSLGNKSEIWIITSKLLESPLESYTISTRVSFSSIALAISCANSLGITLGVSMSVTPSMVGVALRSLTAWVVFESLSQNSLQSFLNSICFMIFAGLISSFLALEWSRTKVWSILLLRLVASSPG